jgi:hypothetical protein
MLRKVSFETGDQVCHGTVRNISEAGALLEGQWDVAVGAGCTVVLGDGCIVHATVRWRNAGQIGVEFRERLSFDGTRGISIARNSDLRKNGVRVAG